MTVIKFENSKPFQTNKYLEKVFRVTIASFDLPPILQL